MNTLTIYQVDAFTDHVFGGNPAAVCLLNHWLPSAIMQSIALENNLSETAFLVKESNRYHIRWFTPTVEVDLCGHATLAAAHILFENNLVSGVDIDFFSQRSGELQVQKSDDGLLTLNFPSDYLDEVYPNAHLIAPFSIAPQKVYKGKSDYLMVYQQEREVRTLEVDFAALAQLDCRGVIVTAKGDIVDFVSRFFAPQSGVNEDPVTGSAHTTLTPYWSKVLDKKVLTAQQISARLGNLKVEDAGERVKISGSAITYLKGEIYF